MGDSKWTSREEFFDFLYRSQFSKMRTFAYAVVSDTDLAEEIVQDAFVEVLIHIEHVMETEKPEWWLQKTVKNKILHVKRSQARYTWRLVSLEDYQLADRGAAERLREVEETDSVNMIRKTIEKTLDSEELHLLKRIAMDGAPYKVVSKETGLSIGACQKRIQRIRKKLKEQLAYK